MRHKTILFREASGTQNIHAQMWLPDTEPRALLQIVHGINEYGGRYDYFARYLTERGIAVAAHDLMGHGATAAETASFGRFAPENGWDNALADIRNFTSLLRRRYPGLPLILLGHSMGSFLARCLLFQYQDRYDAVILTGTSTNPPLVYALGGIFGLTERLRIGNDAPSRLLRALCFGRYVRKFPHGQHPAAWIVRDPEVYKKNGKDPWCRFVPTVGLFREMFRGMRRMDKKRNISRMRQDIPLLLVSGEDDPVGRAGRGVNKVYQWFARAGVRDITLLLYPEARHEILNELNKEEVYQDILEWLGERAPL